VYRVQAIILYKQIIRDNQIRIILFSAEYGKITTWWKWWDNVDIGSIVEVLIERKNGQNILKKIDTSLCSGVSWWNYEEILGYLEVLSTLYEALPDGSEHRRLYQDTISFIREIQNTKVWKVWLLILMQARIMKILGYLSPAIYSMNTELNIIYSDYLSGSMKSMLSGLAISTWNYTHIKNSVLEARHHYSYRN
jgi:recombinational DNA repair protein (RecF pathway)